MELIKKLVFDNTNEIICPIDRPGMIKIIASGELAAEGKDHRLVIRLNGLNSSYKSFIHMSGDANEGEWGNPEEGIYTGRNGWGLDATFMLDYTLTINNEYQKVVGSGTTSFALGDNRILGYKSHGFFVSGSPIFSVGLGITNGGKVRIGDLLVYQM